NVVQPLTQFILTASGNENITATFKTPVSAVGFNAFFNGLGDLTISLFGAAGPGSPFVQITIGGGTDPVNGLADEGFLGFRDTVNLIYGFTWLATGGDQKNTGFTAIEVPAPATPLPAALPLFATGLGALGFLGWRRKRRQAA